MRQIILDTETTGLRTEDGHKIIEVACLEMINRKLTGKTYHQYINPAREVEAGALAVHGITNEFLKDKPSFKQIAGELVEFVSGAELIIHNAPFDVGFLNNELSKPITDYCSILDTLKMARELHVGQRNSLDALCKRYFVDNSKREFHGALLDCYLLAQVYLAMTGGQGSFFDAITDNQSPSELAFNAAEEAATIEKYHLTVLKADAHELAEHAKYMELLERK